MASTIANLFGLQITIGGFTLLIPSPAGLGDMGILSLIALGISVVFSILFVVWIGLIIYAGIKYIASSGNPEQMQGGLKIIQNIIIGIAIFFGFIVVVSIFGAFTGVGNVFEWSENLAQCGESGEFYFTIRERAINSYINSYPNGEIIIACCKDTLDDVENWRYVHKADIQFANTNNIFSNCKNVRTISY